MKWLRKDSSLERYFSKKRSSGKEKSKVQDKSTFQKQSNLSGWIMSGAMGEKATIGQYLGGPWTLIWKHF